MSLFGGIFHALFGGGGPKKDPYAALTAQLNPLIQSQSAIAKQESDAGLANTADARSQLDYVSNYLKNILTGSDDQLMSMFDTAYLTNNIDENIQQLSEQGVRGGKRAAELGQAGFDRSAAIERTLQQLRFSTPDKIANIASTIGNLGLGQFGASTSATSSASQDLFGIEGLRQQDKDRRAALIGSIFEAIGSVAGAVACLDLFTNISTPSGHKYLRDIQVGDKVISRDFKNGLLAYRKVIRIRDTKDQLVKTFPTGRPSATPTHVFYDKKFEEVLCSELESNGEAKVNVRIIKLEDEKMNYAFLANGEYWCCDDDVLE